jgi:hypothetical protein
MKTDRELLELAAKAVAIALEWEGPPDEWQPMYYEDKTYRYWNPLTDDGDALRLAVTIGISIAQEAKNGCVFVDVGSIGVEGEYGEDPCAATRRAIVRAAAELGSQA